MYNENYKGRNTETIDATYFPHSKQHVYLQLIEKISSSDGECPAKSRLNFLGAGTEKSASPKRILMRSSVVFISVFIFRHKKGRLSFPVRNGKQFSGRGRLYSISRRFEYSRQLKARNFRAIHHGRGKKKIHKSHQSVLPFSLPLGPRLSKWRGGRNNTPDPKCCDVIVAQASAQTWRAKN